jgi:5-(aminomethyl)-3-furanmethanol phosphate kinase
VIVAKVGGSLYDDPRLGPALRRWVNEQPEPVLLVPGGGEFADAVRKLDAIHGLGEEAAHWIAVASLTPAAQFLRHLLPGAEVLDSLVFSTRHDLTPHTWAVTSDSLALAAAIHLKASKLVLLKSVDLPPGLSWAETAASGFVDAHFPTLAVGATLPIEAVNFRRWADFRFPGGGR